MLHITVERVFFAPAIFSRFFENEVFAQCYFAVLGGREKNTVAEKNEQQIKHGRGKKNGSEKNVLRGADCRPSTKY